MSSLSCVDRQVRGIYTSHTTAAEGKSTAIEPPRPDAELQLAPLPLADLSACYKIYSTWCWGQGFCPMPMTLLRGASALHSRHNIELTRPLVTLYLEATCHSSDVNVWNDHYESMRRLRNLLVGINEQISRFTPLQKLRSRRTGVPLPVRLPTSPARRR